MEEDLGANLKAKLQPRRPGENLKVAQTVLKRRDRNLQAAAKKAQQVAKRKADERKYKKGNRIVKMETILQRSLRKIKDQKRLKRFHHEKKPKPAKKGQVLAICRNGKPGISKKAKSYLRSLRIRRRHMMTFVLNNEESAQKLQVVRPFAFWGVPSFKNIYNMVHKKAIFVDKDSQEKVVLTDNKLIEKHLGDLGVICTEDLAHVIHTGGKGFEEVMKRLDPVPMGDAKKADGLVDNKNFESGDIKGGINKVIVKLMGE